MDPPGSSMPSLNSNHSMHTGMSAPATSPMMSAAAGAMNAAEALEATNPATQPFALSEASGLEKRARVMSAVAKSADPAASIVLRATSAMREGAAP